MRSPWVPVTGALAALAALSMLSIGGPLPPASGQGQTSGPSAMRPNGAAQSAWAWAARDQAFAILDGQIKGGVEAPPMEMLNVPDLDSWLFRRYRSITEDPSLNARQRERMIAGTIHQDLQLAEWGLTSNEALAQKKALRIATIANLYAGLLPADPRLQAALYEGVSAAPGADGARTGLGRAACDSRRRGGRQPRDRAPQPADRVVA